MPILRQAHKKKFVTLHNSLTQNNSLSLRARGMMAYLLSLPDDWEVKFNHLVKVLQEGKKIITSILQELKEAGYIHHHKMGFKKGWQYFVFEEVTSKEEFKNFLRTIPFSEEFAIANSSLKAPIQKTKTSYIKKDHHHKSIPPKKTDPRQKPPPQVLDPPPTEEEDEKFSKCLKERTATRGPVYCESAYKFKVISEWREKKAAEVQKVEAQVDKIALRKKQAMSVDGQVVNGEEIRVHDNHMCLNTKKWSYFKGERISTPSSRVLSFNATDEEWETTWQSLGIIFE